MNPADPALRLMDYHSLNTKLAQPGGFHNGRSAGEKDIVNDGPLQGLVADCPAMSIVFVCWHRYKKYKSVELCHPSFSHIPSFRICIYAQLWVFVVFPINLKSLCFSPSNFVQKKRHEPCSLVPNFLQQCLWIAVAPYVSLSLCNPIKIIQGLKLRPHQHLNTFTLKLKMFELQ